MCNVATLVLEVEVKLELMAPGALRERLRKAGATPQTIQHQDDLYFTHPGRDFASTDEALRLRRTADGMDLTYKGPKQDGAAKVREEIVLAMPDDPTTLLESLGFTASARIRKQREPWTLGDICIAIDTIDGLGTFAEVEAISTDADQATAEVEAAIEALGLTGAQRFRQSYLELASAAGVNLDVATSP